MSDFVKYIAHYDLLDDSDERACFLPACTKLEYIFSCFEKMGIPFRVLSASGTKGKKAVPARCKALGKQGVLELLPHGGRGHKIKNFLTTRLFRLRFQKKLNQFVEDGDTVIVYHSLELMNPVLRLKKRKNFKLILEVEEVYGDVLCNEKIVRAEYEFFKNADAYLFSTELLNQRINQLGKPASVIYGTYAISPEIEEKLFEDDKIHCVYAGTLDPRKGACIAVNSAEYLPENYRLHILGFGSAKELAEIKELIEKVSSKTPCKVTYDGLLKGEKYLQFLQSCQIGLSTQNKDASFNATSFPSKVLSYLSNGLSVVTVQIPAVKTSRVAPYLHFYDEQTPKEIASAILRAGKQKTDRTKGLEELDRAFCEDLKMLLS